MNIFRDIGEKKMDRKEFLKFSGLLLVGLIGFKGIIELLSGNTAPDKDKTAVRGYGSGKYGR